MSPESFAAWGWRVPFLASVILLGISTYIRLKLQETPVFAEMKAQGRGSAAPLTESFARWGNARLVLKAIFGATAGQGVVWYAGQFYALYFLTATLKVDYVTAYLLVAAALVIGTPFFVVFGRLSDRIGRKRIMLAGFLLTVVTYQPIFHGLTRNANPALADAMERAPVVLHTPDYHGRLTLAARAMEDAARKIVLPSRVVTETDQARSFLNGRGIPFSLSPADDGAPISLSVGGSTVKGFDKKAYENVLAPAGYPAAANRAAMNVPAVIGLLTVLVLYVTLVYGPIAAFLVELFPTRIRYTSMSLPYHIGNGWFGGFLPLIATSIAVFTGDIYAGLWYPILIAGMSLVVGWLVLPETKDWSLTADSAGDADSYSPLYTGLNNKVLTLQLCRHRGH